MPNTSALSVPSSNNSTTTVLSGAGTFTGESDFNDYPDVMVSCYADETSAPYAAMRSKSILTGITGGSTDLSGRNVPFGPFAGPCDLGFMGRVSATTGSIACEFEIFLVSE